MKRQAATSKGLEKRLRNLEFETMSDPRVVERTTYGIAPALTALVAAMVTMASSLRGVEQRTEQITNKQAGWLGIGGRIADNTFGKLLPRLHVDELLERLHRLVKAEHRRGNLKPTVLPVGTAAIDGKNVATLHWHDLCRVTGVKPEEATAELVKERFTHEFPNAQVCIPKHGKPYALLRVHTVTLISSSAAVCIHQRPIPGDTNEIGAMPGVLQELGNAYGRCGLVETLTTDAGNTAVGVNGQIITQGLHYFSQIKPGHGELYDHAERMLGGLRQEEADKCETDTQNGAVVTYHLWRYDLTDHGWLDWTHARQLVRVQRTALNPATGEMSVGNRFYVSSRNTDELDPGGCLAISRAHWRCENNTHWTADEILHEDRRKLAWSRHPNGVLVVAVLRMIALNILAVARKLSRIGHSLETPTWTQVAEHFLLALCASVLHTAEFDADTD